MNKRLYQLPLIIMVCVTLGMMMGCGAKVKHSGFLKDYPDFKPGPEGGLNWVYLKKDVDFGKYNKVMIDFVQFWFKDGTNYKGIHIQELNELAQSLSATVQEYQL